MKKIYYRPTCLVVELSMRRSAMLTASEAGGSQILDFGGEGNGTDIGTKRITDVNLWDEEW